MQRVGCLCPLFLALSTALVIVSEFASPKKTLHFSNRKKKRLSMPISQIRMRQVTHINETCHVYRSPVTVQLSGRVEVHDGNMNKACHKPPKNALIVLFSAEVRPVCSKVIELDRRVQIIMNHFHLTHLKKDFLRVLFLCHTPF